MFISCRTFQIIITSLMLSTLFFRTTRHPNSIDEANFYAGILFFSLISMLFNKYVLTDVLFHVHSHAHWSEAYACICA